MTGHHYDIGLGILAVITAVAMNDLPAGRRIVIALCLAGAFALGRML